MGDLEREAPQLRAEGEEFELVIPDGWALSLRLEPEDALAIISEISAAGRTGGDPGGPDFGVLLKGRLLKLAFITQTTEIEGTVMRVTVREGD